MALEGPQRDQHVLDDTVERNGDREPAARRKHTSNFGQETLRVRNVLKDVETDDGLEGRIVERQRLAARDNLELEVRMRCTCPLDGDPRDVDAGYPRAGSSELRGNAAVSTADVEDSRAASFGWPACTSDDREREVERSWIEAPFLRDLRPASARVPNHIESKPERGRVDASLVRHLIPNFVNP